jgi:hypothetical protein
LWLYVVVPPDYAGHWRLQPTKTYRILQCDVEMSDILPDAWKLLLGCFSNERMCKGGYMRVLDVATIFVQPEIWKLADQPFVQKK